MYDLELVQEILKQILTATEKVINRFKPVNAVGLKVNGVRPRIPFHRI